MSDVDRPAPDGAMGPGDQAEALRKDLGEEYYAILKVVSEFDQRFLTIKGWSVTLSLVALGLGFKEDTAFYFALAALSGLSFWILEALAKRHQLHYYSRMRDIEVACFHLNRVPLPGLGEVSAPRIDETWSFDGRPFKDPQGIVVPDWRLNPPMRREPDKVHRLLLRPWWMPHVMLPHALAVIAGLVLCLGAFLGVQGLPEFP